LVEVKKRSSKYIYGSVAYDIEPVIQPKRVKQPAKRTKPTKKFKLMGRIIIIFMLSFLLVYRFTLVMKLTYDIRATKAQITQLNNDNGNIRIDLAQLNNIKQIEKDAVDKCGMVIPTKDDIKYINVKPLTVAPQKYDENSYKMIQKLLGLIY
jgi:hypothetical protein